ncbi:MULTISPECIES: hypothetical protein [Burkholderiaceae]|jgi:hypothetical protein|uniref:Uncharacterized protein n=2 Tax=Burkholderiaceae TaxID=119060 RepID=A0A6J5JHD1_9BURK|nr:MULTISPECIES: hypothetical protein [Burkholderiaceae]ANJ73093.1 hypothetical protein A9Y76_11695 [Ralstonia insidiosa]KAB0601844.1 hypothetical protein F7R19_15195 [Cupriavidus pauculus]MBR8498375.1 hypothetical protein [Burkholderia cenocepacia]UAL00277.1 hypothetical protein K8O84_02550 [Cupriavidus pauculus]CAB3970725.1 hypothetical protein BLA3211_06088 [Burkholderia aenigmatica]
MTHSKLFATVAAVLSLTVCTTALADSTGIARRSSEGKVYETTFDMTSQFKDGDATYNTWRDFYWSKAKKDYQGLAEDFSFEYNKNSNAFGKQDLLKALTPKLDASYSTAQRIKNVSIKTPFTASVKAYQPGKGFAIYASVNKTNFIDKYRSLGYGSGRYYLVLLNPSFKTNGFNQATDYFFNPDEQTARKLEGYLSAHRSNANDLVLMDIQVNGYVLYTESQGNDRYTVIAPDSITLLGKNREPIVTIESKYMDKTVLIQNDMDGDPTIKAIFQKIKKAFGVKDAPKTGGVYLS